MAAVRLAFAANERLGLAEIRHRHASINTQAFWSWSGASSRPAFPARKGLVISEVGNFSFDLLLTDHRFRRTVFTSLSMSEGDWASIISANYASSLVFARARLCSDIRKILEK
jgi:hypothetical protein